jgi:hypothetical protein
MRDGCASPLYNILEKAIVIEHIEVTFKKKLLA